MGVTIWATLRDRIERLGDVALCLISKWWRPVLYVEYIVSFAINLVVIPLYNWEVPDLSAAATYLAAGAALTGIRAWEKNKGVARGHSE